MHLAVLDNLLGPAGPELTCEECFEFVDEHVDLDPDIPGMRAHLQGCPACNEDHASLRALVIRAPGPARPQG